ncbi:hypothetical protein GCM10010517_12240 [Streptosporangium fragile]|uniref:DUF4097 domain-containing protein n=1 Tax=Streptosporangium fragile TaxID=46186 RepID=A0ABN3VRK3_9ACTN
MKKNLLVAGALLSSVFALSGCQFGLDFRDQNQDVVSYDVTDKVTALEVESGSGDIVINESDRSGIHVTETVHWRGKRPATEHNVDGGRLTLRYACDDPSCSVDYKVEVPRGLTAKLDTGSGTITLRGLSGKVDAVSGSGDVDAGDLRARRFVADTGSGEIEARFRGTPDHVEIESGSGDATAYLPKGSYDVTAETGSGDRTIEVTDDPSAPRKVTVKTGSGNVGVLIG